MLCASESKAPGFCAVSPFCTISHHFRGRQQGPAELQCRAWSAL